MSPISFPSMPCFQLIQGRHHEYDFAGVVHATELPHLPGESILALDFSHNHYDQLAVAKPLIDGIFPRFMPHILSRRAEWRNPFSRPSDRYYRTKPGNYGRNDLLQDYWLGEKCHTFLWRFDHQFVINERSKE